jgi:enoyl-CoA hydratase
MTEYKNLQVERKDAILIVKINRERALNALNKETVGELQQLFSYYWTDDSVKCVIVTGTGEKSFVAGADIPELADLDIRSGADLAARGLYLMKTIQNFPRPVIAAINGFALGGGCELAMACDMIVASELARFGQPEVTLGIIPGAGGTQRLTRAVGKALAMEMILNNRHLTADEAKHYGLVNQVVPVERYLGQAIRLAAEIAERAPIAVRLAKAAVNQAFETSLNEGILIERQFFTLLFATEDQKEGMAAFIEKRPPEWKGQ